MHVIQAKVKNLPSSFLENFTPALNNFAEFKQQLINNSKNISNNFIKKQAFCEKTICEMQIQNLLIFMLSRCLQLNILNDHQLRDLNIQAGDDLNKHYLFPYHANKSIAYILQMFYPGNYPSYNQWKKIYNVIESLIVKKEYSGYKSCNLDRDVTTPIFSIQTITIVDCIITFLLPQHEYFVPNIWDQEDEIRNLKEDVNLWFNMMSKIVQVELL